MRVRATGSTHSRSPLYVDEGNILMDVRNLRRHDGPALEFHPPVSGLPYLALTIVLAVVTVDVAAVFVVVVVVSVVVVVVVIAAA